jgi:hypothetical protein
MNKWIFLNIFNKYIFADSCSIYRKPVSSELLIPQQEATNQAPAKKWKSIWKRC